MDKDVCFIKKQKHHLKKMLLRIINSRGVVSFDILHAIFFYGAQYYHPSIDLSDVEIHDSILSLTSSFIEELQKEEKIKVLVLPNFLEETKCCCLTLTGSWETFSDIHKSPKNKLVHHCFLCQIEDGINDEFFINEEETRELELNHGPFPFYDDPSNPNSQENQYVIY